MKNCEYQKVVDDTLAELRNPKKREEEWVKIFQNRARGILNNLDNIKQNRKQLHMWAPLTFSIKVTSATSTGKTVKIDVKYLGQNVAELSIEKDKVYITTNPDKKGKTESNNERYFGCEIKLNDVPWKSAEARKFRRYFKDRIPEKSLRQESRIESLLLTEFAKSTDKLLRNIQPVMIGDVNFPMPTPLKASIKGVEYSRNSSGGIDILARVGTGGRHAFLCVIEVKDENKQHTKEPPTVVIKQAIKYATFIRELVRSDAGKNWWKIFGFGGEVPKKLLIHATCAMPDDNPD